jgi:integrase
MMLVTGQRKGNVLRMKWSEVDLTKKLWTIPMTKSGKTHRVPLNEAAVSILQQQEKFRETDNPHVFPGQKIGSSLKTVQKTWSRARRAAGVENCRLHDLRHTYASILVQRGVNLYVVSKLLGHHAPSMTARYAHLADNTLVEASDIVGTMVILD